MLQDNDTIGGAARGQGAERLVDLRGSIESSVGRALFRLVELPVERALALNEINRLYRASRTLVDGEEPYFTAALNTLDVGYKLTADEWQRIPATGPVILVANHPFGALEGLVLGDIATRVRQDVRLLGNHLLQEIAEIRPWLISVDVFGGDGAPGQNVGALKAAVRWLKAGGVLATFPAGAVSHLQIRDGQVSDPPWSPHVAALARRTGATVVPVFFEGRNSNLFQVAGLLHPVLRTALLPSEMLKRRRSTLAVRLGRPIGPDKLARYADDGTLTDYLRFKTYALKRRESPVRPRFRPQPLAITAGADPLIPPISARLLEGEMARVAPVGRLASAGDLEVVIAGAAEIPAVLREIGRLRELTFRAVSEGTGRACDLDAFDQHYLHLVMWNRAKAEVVGAYRIGQVDKLLQEHGPTGLYTSSLFKFRAGFLERLGMALELGRSFVRAEYQRKPTSLALLWRGIGEYLVRHPHYKTLFGPVSISRDYQSLSRRIMVDFLEKQRRDEVFSPLVRAKNPPRDRLLPDERRALQALAKDADDLSALVEEIEEDNKGMPVLLRHYLRLNARILSFNVDPEFGHCLDGLILVDLRNTDSKMLKRVMGEEGLAFYNSVR